MIKFFNRAFGGIVILSLLILITYMGRIPLALGVAAFSYIALHEMDKALKKIDLHLPIKCLYLTNGIIMLAAFINNSDIYIASIVISVLFLFMYIILTRHYRLYDAFAAAFVMLYVSFLISHILRIKDVSYVWMLYITAWGSDTFAYLVGSLFGRHKMDWMAHISPNKTIEGSVGGIIGATVLNIIYCKEFGLDTYIREIIIFTIIAAIMSQIGDLIASYIKRQTGIKDFGNLIPGHGGILDRFDSIMFIAPILYLFSRI
ncbi:phosphatidate cytidylyltransferase [uncultured Anaerococcus sp.]|uniref:phosphatidate cytidylyltransferase n=1 Tax=uncultured Anaerococcus sp. TaxID=293428 RepID=UPI0025E68BC2|nr:phosphatidate cytidylyltransferase [uncultured Anaerococcus sp.]